MKRDQLTELLRKAQGENVAIILQCADGETVRVWWHENQFRLDRAEYAPLSNRGKGKEALFDLEETVDSLLENEKVAEAVAVIPCGDLQQAGRKYK